MGGLTEILKLSHSTAGLEDQAGTYSQALLDSGELWPSSRRVSIPDQELLGAARERFV